MSKKERKRKNEQCTRHIYKESIGQKARKNQLNKGTTFSCLIMDNVFQEFRTCLQLKRVFCYFESGDVSFGYYGSGKVNT